MARRSRRKRKRTRRSRRSRRSHKTRRRRTRRSRRSRRRRTRRTRRSRRRRTRRTRKKRRSRRRSGPPAPILLASGLGAGVLSTGVGYLLRQRINRKYDERRRQIRQRQLQQLTPYQLVEESKNKYGKHLVRHLLTKPWNGPQDYLNRLQERKKRVTMKDFPSLAFGIYRDMMRNDERKNINKMELIFPGFYQGQKTSMEDFIKNVNKSFLKALIDNDALMGLEHSRTKGEVVKQLYREIQFIKNLQIYDKLYFYLFARLLQGLPIESYNTNKNIFLRTFDKPKLYSRSYHTLPLGSKPALPDDNVAKSLLKIYDDARASRLRNRPGSMESKSSRPFRRRRIS